MMGACHRRRSIPSGTPISLQGNTLACSAVSGGPGVIARTVAGILVRRTSGEWGDERNMLSGKQM